MKKLSFLLMAMLMSVMSFAVETVAYTLTTTATGENKAPHNAYASAAEATYDGITWNVTGNSSMEPWRIGGKSITAVDRAVYTKTAMAADITKIEITHATVNLTCNSCILTISDAANGEGETFPVTVTQNTTTTITLPEGDYSNKYYKLVYNVTNTTTSNKYVQLKEIKFYTEVQTSVEAPTFTPEEGKVAANNTFAEPFALTIASATEGATIKYTLDGTDPALETALTYEAPITISTMVQVRAIAVKGEESSVEATATYIVASTEEKPYTASEAIAAEALGLTGNVYVTGTVKSIEELSTQYGNATYNITDGVKELKIYRGKNLENAKFTSADQLLVGDVVVVKGDLTSYNGAAQLGQNNYLISRSTPVVSYVVTVSANPAEAGTVTGDGEYEENAEATLTATANEGYEFTCWTSGEDTVSTANPYTFAVTANLALVANFKEVVVEPTTETIYFINATKWAKVNVYAWTTDPNASWPGAAATKEAEQIAGYDVYSYTLEAGAAANVIFNNGSGAQTADLKWTAGKYYVLDGWYTKEEAEAKLAAPLPEVWTIVGAAGLMGKDWDLNAAENAMTKQDDGTYKLEKKGITLTAGTYEYKAAKDHGWDVSVPAGQTNQKLTISTSGIYDVTFVLNVTAKTLQATATLKQAAVIIPTVVIAGDMNSWSQTKDKFTMSADSLTATFKATLAVKNYGFKMIVGGAWHSDGKTITRAANSTKFTGANGDNSILKADIAGEYLFTWEYATKTLTVTYPALPVKYNVTVTAEHGTVTGAGTYEEGKTATLTATPAEGYQFVNWTVGEEVVSTENPYTFTVTADVALVANFKAVEPEIEWIEMPLEITNLVTVVMEVGGAKYLQLAGRNDMNDADVTLFLNNYADVDDDYEVNAENSYMTFGGMEFTVIEGVMTQTSETDKGTIYTGTVYASVTDEEEGGTMYVKFALTMYAAPATVLVLTDAIVAINEKLGTLTFNVVTGEGEGYYAELAGYTAPGVHEGPQICVFMTPEVAAYANYVETSVVDGVITLTGEFTSLNGPKFDLTISGKLPGSGTALENIAVEGKAVKAIINGQLIIIKNGVQYNAQGQVVK